MQSFYYKKLVLFAYARNEEAFSENIFSNWTDTEGKQ